MDPNAITIMVVAGDVSAIVIMGMTMIMMVVFITKGIPLLLAHAREMEQMKRGANSGTDALHDRVAALEQRCAKLEEQVTEAHLLLADEQRQMDQKLAAILPDTPAPAFSIPDTKPRGAERQPVSQGRGA